MAYEKLKKQTQSLRAARRVPRCTIAQKQTRGVTPKKLGGLHPEAPDSALPGANPPRPLGIVKGRYAVPTRLLEEVEDDAPKPLSRLESGMLDQ